MKLFLFDVDLTLISTGGAGLRALDRACREILSRDGCMDGISPHGKTDPLIVREILYGIQYPFSRNLVDSILASYLCFLREEVAESASYRVLPGVRELLGELQTRSGVLLGLATGNIHEGARIKLERAGLNPFFRFGGFGSDAEDRVAVVRRAIDEGCRLSGNGILPEDVWVIGDTPRDVEAGREAGCRTVAVATGGYSIEDLRTTGADLAIEDFDAGRDQFLRSTRIL